MAYGVKYRIGFADVDDQPYQVDIEFDGYSGGITTLDGVGGSLSIAYEDSDNKFNPVNGSGCSLGFYNDGTLSAEDFFVVGAYDVRVMVTRYNAEADDYLDVWGGYLNPEVFEEDYSWSEGSITLTANDSLSAIKREKYFTGADVGTDGLVIKPWALGTALAKDVISECLDVGIFYRIYTMVDTQGATSEFEDMEVDLSNYVDEDGESMNKREVLESILEPYTLRAYIFGFACWIIDPTLMAATDATVPFKAYSGTFVAIPLEDGVYSKDFDISSGDLRFLDGDQTVSLVGGFKTMISNYSAYPDEKKIVPFQPDEIVMRDYEPWVYNAYTNGEGGYFYRRANLVVDWFALYGVTFNTLNGYISEYKTSTDGVTPEKFSGKNWFMISNSCYDHENQSNTDPDEETVKISGGWIPKNDDVITVKFDVLVDATSVRPTMKTNIIEIPIQFKVGSKYGVMSAGVIDSWSSSPVTNLVGVDARLHNEAGDGMRTILPIDYDFKNVPESGMVELIFGRRTYLQLIDQTLYAVDMGTLWTADMSGGTPYTFWALYSDLILMFGDFEMFINNTEISDEDLEYKTESGVDFINKHTIEINNSSRRVNGILDRGAFINENGEHETYFSRDSFPQSGSIGLTMAKAYMGNYETPYRKINATLGTTGDMFRNDADVVSELLIPLSIDNVFTPLSIIQDTSHLGTKRFIFSGGTIDLLNKTIRGTWDEIFDANYTITED